MAFLPDATAKIYRLSDTVNPIWTGITDTSGRVIDAGGQLPSLSYGDYRVVIEKCDYDTETSDFTVPETSLLNLTVGCSSAITAHETAYDHTKLITGLTLPSGIGPLPYLGTTPPSGWLLCDGSAISRSIYAGLFAVIGITSGAGDGSTTFNLPDMRGRVPVGIGASGVATLGSVGGEQTHIDTIAEMPAHTHVQRVNSAGAGATGTPMASSFAGSVSSVSSTDSTGGDAAHNNMQPYLGVNYIISI